MKRWCGWTLSLRGRVALELLTLGLLTPAFLVVLPHRPLLLDLSLALLALGLLGLSARFTTSVVWARFPSPVAPPDRLRLCLRKVLTLTLSGVLMLLVGGIVIGYAAGGWPVACRRVANGSLLVAIGLYFPWALLQQALFQFYLLGRLRVFLPAAAAITGTGLAFALVHLPDLGVTIAAAAAGIYWTHLYNTYRVISPLALSHAVLGATFYYWLYGRDLLFAWARLGA